MQALFEGSEEEITVNESIGFFKGRVERFKTELSVPHIGWNGINIKQDSPPAGRCESRIPNFTLFIPFILYLKMNL